VSQPFSIEKEVDQQDLCSRNEKLAADLTKASDEFDSLRSKMEALADERSRVLGQLDCLKKQLAARDLSLGELQQLQTKLEELQAQLGGTISAFELQSTVLVQREKDYHE
jgi:predicted nuclease with TOPRIM domain